MLTPGNSRSLGLAQPSSGAQRGLPIPLSHQLLQAQNALAQAAQAQAAQAQAAQTSQAAVGPRPGSAVSRSGSVSEAPAAPKPVAAPVQGSAAEGWKISIVFRGKPTARS